VGGGPLYACTTKYVPFKVFLTGWGKGRVPYKNDGDSSQKFEKKKKKTPKDIRNHIFKGGEGEGGNQYRMYYQWN